jgi:hypothetical protein
MSPDQTALDLSVNAHMITNTSRQAVLVNSRVCKSQLYPLMLRQLCFSIFAPGINSRTLCY